MRKSLLLFFLCFIAGTGFSQSGFHRLYGGDHFDYGYDVVELPDSGFFVTGMSGSITPGHSQAFLLRLDKNGNKLWSLPYGGVENDGAFDLEYRENVGTYLLGRTTDSNGGFDMWISLVNDQGDVQWERTYAGPQLEEAVESAMTNDLGLIVGVHRFGTGLQDQDVSLIRLDAAGDTVWAQEISQPGIDEIMKIEQYQDSLFIIASNHLDTLTDRYYGFLQIIHEDGDLVWSDTVGISPGNSYFNDFFLSNDTLYGVGAHKLDDTSTFNRMRHVRYLPLAETGEILTQTSVSAANIIDDVVTSALGSIYKYSSFRYEDPTAATVNYDYYLGLNTYLVTPLGSGGNSVTEGDDRLYEAIPTLDSGVVFVGFQSLSTGGTAIVVLKIGKNFGYPTIPENPIVFSLAGQDEFTLNNTVSIYPNPTTNEVNVRVQDGSIDAYTIVNLNGKEMSSGSLLKEANTVSTSSLASGVYLLQLFNEDAFIGAQRLIVQ
jgi:hypothetical protein